MTPPGPPRRAAHPHPASRRLVAHGPADLLAFVPLALGFVPAESVVLLSVGRAGPHARVDLPTTSAAAHLIGRELARTFSRHGVDRVALVLYSADPEPCWARLEVISGQLGGTGLQVVDQLVAGPADFWEHPDGPPRSYRPDSHPFRVEAVVDGLVVHSSRQEVRDQVVADPQLRAHVGHELPRRVRESAEVTVEQRWARIHDQLAAGRSPTAPRDLVDALIVAADPDHLHLIWTEVRREQASVHLDFWLRVLRAAPPDRVPAVAGVTGYLAWLCGNGALAWSALERGEEAGPHALLGMVRELVSRAAAPPGT